MASVWQRFPDVPSLIAAARTKILDSAQQAIQQRGVFRLVLAGGSTPRELYSSLVGVSTNWHAWHIYYGDERVVSEIHPERNSRMVASHWLDHVHIPMENIHVIPTERGLIEAIALYEHVLAQVDMFDMVLLGLGEDGHTASLFPGNPWGLEPDAPPVLPVCNAPKPPSTRVTLSAQRLSRTREILFLIRGRSKKEAVKRWLAGEHIPAAVLRAEAHVYVFLDEDAAP